MNLYFISVLLFSGSSLLSCTQEKNLYAAHVKIVKVTGKENSYWFAVTLKSPDKGCTQYADWWEVISQDGSLIYRRTLAHSHVDEQPFTRSGGPVAISADEVVIIRAHMHPSGYGTGKVVLKGSVKTGFLPVTLEKGFAVNLESVAPRPGDCRF